MASSSRVVDKVSLASASSSSQELKKFDVFLSFRGEDTRNNFTSHLHKALCQKGIITFKDDKELERGKPISHQLPKAIQGSKISIIILSKNYATSTWCLDELVEILESHKAGSGSHWVLPIFYDVSPSQVRKQEGSFGESFYKYKEIFKENIGKVQQWRVALREVANLSGWDAKDRHESELIEEIVEEVLSILRKSSHRFSSETQNFVGLGLRLEEMNSYLCIEQLDDVRIIGICGMGGIGKTTIARAVFVELSCQFEGSCFLANVREIEERYGLIPLQEQLLSEILMDRNITVWDAHCGIHEIKNRLCHRRVLIILDDVNQLDQLKSLAGMCDWFGRGSRIIITTRDEHLLICHGVDKIYKVEGLNHDEALQLFCLKALKNDYPIDDYMELSNQFVNYADGLPLALDVLGSFLYGRSVNEWKSTLHRLKEIPNKEILDKLYISFDGLEEVEKKIFLDIACFFKGDDKDYVTRVLESFGFYPDIGIRVLLDKSLISISNDRVWMHDLLQEMGQEIVRRSCYEEPGKRSRLWLSEDVYHVLVNNTGTEQVEAIVLDCCEQEDEMLSAKVFIKMNRLRFLKLQNLHFSEDLKYLSNELRYFDWDTYPFEYLPSAFQPAKLVELHMRRSNVKQPWKGKKHLKMLKVIDLSYSINLIKTMDFSEVPNLEELNLEGCTRLIEIHKYIGILKSLVLLNLQNCKSIKSLPSSICDLKSLKFFNMRGCSKLKELPERLGEMTCLEKLYVCGIATRTLPSAKPWDYFLPSRLLQKKNLNLMALMLHSLSVLCSLRSLDLSYCNLMEGALPYDLSCLALLQKLNLSGNNFASIPPSVNQLSKLEFFRLANCKRLESLPNLPSSILYLSIDGCPYMETLLPTRINRQIKFKNLCFVDCKRLQSYPDLSSSIIYLDIDGLTAQESIPNLFEMHASKRSSLCIVNGLHLIEIQSKGNMAFARVLSYLHFLLKHSSEAGHFNPSSHISMILTGSEIPRWFKYQGIGSSLKMQLPLFWWSNRWMGFSFCIVFEFHEAQSDTCSIFGDFHACIVPDQYLFLGRSTAQIPTDTCIKSEKLWFNFIPRKSLTCLDRWDAHSYLKASFFSNQLKVKYCGFRLIYSRDIDELVACNRLTWS